MRGATVELDTDNSDMLISTHTPHAGRDVEHGEVITENQRFLLTRPMRGATGLDDEQLGGIIISTHTPHAGRDDFVKFRYRNIS